MRTVLRIALAVSVLLTLPASTEPSPDPPHPCPADAVFVYSNPRMAFTPPPLSIEPVHATSPEQAVRAFSASNARCGRAIQRIFINREKIYLDCIAEGGERGGYVAFRNDLPLGRCTLQWWTGARYGA